MNNIVQTNIPGLVRDVTNGAILNIDNEKLRAYKTQKKSIEKTQLLEAQINNMKDQMIAIEDKLNRILEKL